MESTIKLYSLKAIDAKSYVYAALFVAGNLVLPQLCHLLPLGGQMLLPIYFFTLIAAYKYGFFTGLLTAVASPLVNHAIFGMPATEMLPIILIKSVLLAVAAGYMAQRTKHIKIQSLLVVILFYQGIGMIAEFLLTGSFIAAMQDIRLGLPGILFQLIGGYFCLKALRNI
ncbi:MAG: ECF transporter S component [Bacteroidota bacterium]|nr:ECF transporter S component [Bacteroidota bacterium]